MKKLVVLALFFLQIAWVAGQIDVKGKIENEAENRVEQKTNEGVSSGFDQVEEGIGNLFKKKKKKEKTEVQSEQLSENQEANVEEPSETPQDKPQLLSTFSKFDFVAGDKIIYFNDFAHDVVGDFPAGWNTNGSGEVMTTNLYPGNWFKFMAYGYYLPDMAFDLGDNFTVEYDLIPQSSTGELQDFEYNFCLIYGDYKNPDEGGAIPGISGCRVNFSAYQTSFTNYNNGEYGVNGNKDFEIGLNTKHHISIWVQKQRIRIYHNETKILDIIKGIPEGPRPNVIRFEPTGDYSQPLISNLRIAAGLPDMRNKLLTDGILVTRGILFDVNSDKIKPESTGVLREIAKVLNDNPDVKVKIVGHTDSDGNDAQNLDLSKRRAASVKLALSSLFNIEPTRMTTDGKGEDEPLMPNTSPEGKANNRRVVFIKQ